MVKPGPTVSASFVPGLTVSDEPAPAPEVATSAVTSAMNMAAVVFMVGLYGTSRASVLCPQLGAEAIAEPIDNRTT
jgi:hypothetical protein